MHGGYKLLKMHQLFKHLIVRELGDELVVIII